MTPDNPTAHDTVRNSLRDTTGEGTPDGVVLVIGSGAQRYREYLLSSAGRQAPLWLIETAPLTWQRPYVVGGSVVPFKDPAKLVPDVAGLIEAALAVARTRPVAGVFSYDEMLVVATARIAARLGRPGFTIPGAQNIRNKQRTRAGLTAAGIRQPGFVYAAGPDEARAAAERFGYPVVVKPRGMGASIGVVRVDRPADLDAAVAMADAASFGPNPDYDGGVLVEEFLTGPEISVDAAVLDGEYRPFTLARKRTGLEPYFEETGHTVDAADPLLSDPELTGMLAAAHRALGVRTGMTHTEVKLTAAGPVVVEINGRLGGDLIPYLGRLAHGIDPGRTAADVARGVRPDLTPRFRRSVGIRFVYPKAHAVVEELRMPSPGEIPGLLEAHAVSEPGTVLRLPPDAYLSRAGYLIGAGPDPAACTATLDAAEAAVHLRAAPLPEPRQAHLAGAPR